MNRKLALFLVCSLMFSSSIAMEDWEVYVPIRKCGAKLIQYIMDEDLCNPDKCEGKSQFASVILFYDFHSLMLRKVSTSRPSFYHRVRKMRAILDTVRSVILLGTS